MRSNPSVTLDDAAAVRRFATAVNAVMAQAQQSTRIAYRDEELESVQVQGVTRRVPGLHDLRCRARPA